MNIYYAHPMSMYGTREEKLKKAQIKRAFPGSHIVDPSLFPDHEMAYYLRRVERCNMVVFSRLEGKIGAGIGKEINHALKSGMPVFELLNGGNVTVVTEPVKHLTVAETIKLLKKSGYYNRKAISKKQRLVGKN